MKIDFIFVLTLNSITHNQIEPFRELLDSTVKLTLCWGNWDGKDDNEAFSFVFHIIVVVEKPLSIAVIIYSFKKAYSSMTFKQAPQSM